MGDVVERPVTEEYQDENGNTVIVGYPSDRDEPIDDLTESGPPRVGTTPNLPI